MNNLKLAEINVDLILNNRSLIKKESLDYLINFNDYLNGKEEIENLDDLILPYLGSESVQSISDQAIEKYKSDHKSSQDENGDDVQLKRFNIIKENLYEFFCTKNEKFKNLRNSISTTEDLLNSLLNVSNFMLEASGLEAEKTYVTSIKIILISKKLAIASLCDFFSGDFN